MRCLKGFEVYRFAGIGMGLGAILVIAGASFSSRVDGQDAKGYADGSFRVTYPDLSQLDHSPCLEENPTPCAAESAALASAILALEAARQTAQDMYDAWVACLDANGGGPNPGPAPEPVVPSTIPKTTPTPAGTVSILAK